MLLCVRSLEDFSFVLDREEENVPIFYAMVPVRNQEKHCELKMFSCGVTKLYLRMELSMADAMQKVRSYGERIRKVSNISVQTDQVQILSEDDVVQA